LGGLVGTDSSASSSCARNEIVADSPSARVAVWSSDAQFVIFWVAGDCVTTLVTAQLVAEFVTLQKAAVVQAVEHQIQCSLMVDGLVRKHVAYQKRTITIVHECASNNFARRAVGHWSLIQNVQKLCIVR
jgi:pyocin large subunit-like protein